MLIFKIFSEAWFMGSKSLFKWSGVLFFNSESILEAVLTVSLRVRCCHEGCQEDTDQLAAGEEPQLCRDRKTHITCECYIITEALYWATYSVICHIQLYKCM